MGQVSELLFTSGFRRPDIDNPDLSGQLQSGPPQAEINPDTLQNAGAARYADRSIFSGDPRDAGHGGIFQYHAEFVPKALAFLAA